MIALPLPAAKAIEVTLIPATDGYLGGIFFEPPTSVRQMQILVERLIPRDFVSTAQRWPWRGAFFCRIGCCLETDRPARFFLGFPGTVHDLKEPGR